VAAIDFVGRTDGRDGLCPVPFFPLPNEKKEKASDGTEAVPPFSANVTSNNVSSAIHGARGLSALQGLDQHWSTADPDTCYFRNCRLSDGFAMG